jgi:hypothetical protein
MAHLEANRRSKTVTISARPHRHRLHLQTGRQLWKSQLEGIGETRHSAYLNLVNIETDGQIIIVTGNEAHGRYIEHLDLKNGKTLANKKLEADPKSLLGG